MPSAGNRRDGDRPVVGGVAGVAGVPIRIAFLHAHLYRTGECIAVLRLEPAGGDVDFLNRPRRHRAAHRPTGQHVFLAHTVGDVDHLVAAAAANMHFVVLHDDAGLLLDEVGNTFEGDVLDVFGEQ